MVLSHPKKHFYASRKNIGKIKGTNWLWKLPKVHFQTWKVTTFSNDTSATAKLILNFKHNDQTYRFVNREESTKK